METTQPLVTLPEKMELLQYTGLEPGCIGIKIRVTSQKKTQIPDAGFGPLFLFQQSCYDHISLSREVRQQRHWPQKIRPLQYTPFSVLRFFRGKWQNDQDVPFPLVKKR